MECLTKDRGVPHDKRITRIVKFTFFEFEFKILPFPAQMNVGLRLTPFFKEFLQFEVPEMNVGLQIVRVESPFPPVIPHSFLVRKRRASSFAFASSYAASKQSSGQNTLKRRWNDASNAH